jgi:HEAT repeat protein
MDVETLISQFHASDDSAERVHAARQLGEVGGERAITALGVGLSAEPGMVAEAAAIALAGVEDERAAQYLMTAADPSGPEMRVAAAAAGLRALGQRDPGRLPEVISALEGVLDNEGFRAVTDAVDALETIGSEPAFDALLAAVRGEHSHEASTRAIRAVAHLPHASGPRAEEVLPALASALADTYTSRDAAYGLARLPGGVDVLLTALEHDDSGYIVANALAESGDPRAIPVLRAKLRSSMGRGAGYALTRLGPAGVRAMVDAYVDPDRDVRDLAAEMLGRSRAEIGEPLRAMIGHAGPEAIPAARLAGELMLETAREPLAEAVGSQAPELRLAALDALTRIGAPGPVPTLTQCLDDTEPEIRAAAVRALTTTGAPQTVARIAALLGDTDARVQAAAAHAIAELGVAAGHEHELIDLLGEDDPALRAAAAQALASADQDKAFEPLLVALGDRARRVRNAAAATLARFGPDAVTPLAKRLSDPSKDVRDAAADALGMIGEAAYPELQRAAASGGARPRAAATAALARAAVDSSQPLRAVMNGLDDESEEVQREALLGLARLPATRMLEVDETTIERVLELLLDSGSPHDEIAASTLLALGSPAAPLFVTGPLDPGPMVASQLETTLRRGPRRARRAVAVAIAASLRELQPAAQPFPGWFSVRREPSLIHTSAWVSPLMSALSEATEDPDLLIREAARDALSQAGTVLAAKRAPVAFVDEHPMYFRAPESNLDVPLPEERQAELPTGSGPRPRYADITVFDHVGERLSDGEPLRVRQRSTLEVAVRRVRTGLSREAPAAAIVEPGTAETIDILVVLDADGVDVEPTSGWLKLPPEGDSVQNPRFELTPRTPGLTEVSIRLYYNFNLLESVRVVAEVVSRLRPAPGSHLGLKEPLALEQDRIARGFEGLEDTVPRAIHVDVEQENGTYTFRFAMVGPGGREIVLTGSKRLDTSYLQDRLVSVRRELDMLVLGTSYATEVAGSKSLFHDALRSLAEVGRELWQNLFRANTQTEPSLWRIGEWLTEHPPPPESVIQISLDDSASDLVFPWGFVYDRELPQNEYEDPDPEGFWGIRYVIEQQAPGRQPDGPDVVRRTNGPLSVAYMLWGQFPKVQAHSDAVAQLGSRAPRRALVSTPPVERPSTFISLVQDRDPEDILYFFTHGSTRRPASALGLDTAGLLLEVYRGLPQAVRDDPAVRAAYESLAEEGSWLKLTYGKLKLGPLRGLAPGTIAPLVFLNACESAQLFPSFGDDSFVSFFLAWGARTVIGTECRMTVHFAYPFGEAVLDAVMDGIPVGLALLRTRRSFIEKRNPLGLAYTLYGSACAGFGPASQSTRGST